MGQLWKILCILSLFYLAQCNVEEMDTLWITALIWDGDWMKLKEYDRLHKPITKGDHYIVGVTEVSSALEHIPNNQLNYQRTLI